MDHFFQDLKVVELAGVLAGPAVGMFFAELGAEVIKVENRTTGGDVTRRWKAPTEDQGASDSAYYHSINYGKQVHLLDFHDPADHAQVMAWVAAADVVIVNFKPGSAGQFGLDYDSLAARRPALIYAEITGYGSHDDRPAFDIVLQAETGFLHMTGQAGGPPAKLPVALIDLLAAHQLKEGILLALLRRAATGLGSRVSVSLYDAAVASLANQATNWLIAGHSPQRIGTQHPNIAPYGDLFTTADGRQLVLAVGAEKQFRQLCAVLNMPDLAEDERFRTNVARVRQREALVAKLSVLIKKWERDTLLEELHRAGVPAGAVRDLPELFAQPAAQRLLLTSRSETGETVCCVKTVVFELGENQSD